MMKLGKRSKIVLGILGGLVIVQCAGYWLFAEHAIPTSLLGRTLNSDPVRKLDYVVVPRSTWDSLTVSEQQALTSYLHTQAPHLYHSVFDVPLGQKTVFSLTPSDVQERQRNIQDAKMSKQNVDRWQEEIQIGHRVVGLTGGISLYYEVKERGSFWMRAHTQSWVSVTGGDFNDDIYIWAFFGWIKAYSMARAAS